MRSLISGLVVLHSLINTGSYAAPAPLPSATPDPLFGFNPIAGLAPAVEDELAKIAAQLANTKPTKTPASIPDAVSTLKDIFGPKPTGIISNGLKFVVSGLQVGAGLEGATIDDPAPPGNINSFHNNNPAPPSPVFPQKAQGDAPYSISENQLRSAIFIPKSFQGMGSAPNPVILVPGTGAFGGVNFEGNVAKILAQNSSIGQAVWLNVPGAMLDDVQTNAEYIAYAMNYIASLTGAKVSVVGWSQGNLASQWALKYWPSTRNSTKQLVSFSPDFHGTVIANVVDLPIVDAIPLPPAVYQQQYTSNLIKTLRSNGGDSAYVPTTSLYSAVFDEVVEPQQGTAASAFINDARGIGVSNNEIQAVCPNTPAGDFATHESMLFNGLATALAVDALVHGGPADPKRLNLAVVCQELAYPGLNVEDVVITEGLIPLAGLNILEFRPGVTQEPAIRSYAR